MKKVVLLFMIVAGMLTLSACTPEDETPQSETPILVEEEAPVTEEESSEAIGENKPEDGSGPNIEDRPEDGSRPEGSERPNAENLPEGEERAEGEGRGDLPEGFTPPMREEMMDKENAQ